MAATLLYNTPMSYGFIFQALPEALRRYMSCYRRADWSSMRIEFFDKTHNWSSYQIEYKKLANGFLGISINVRGLDPPRLSWLNYFLKEYLELKRGRQIARPFLAQMLVHGTIPNFFTFVQLTKCYCKSFTYHHLEDLVTTQMDAVGVMAPDSFYEKLIYKVCVRFGPVRGYQLVKKFRINDEIEVPLSCYNAVVHHFCARNDATMVLELIRVLMDMKQVRVFPDEKIYKCLIRWRGHGGDSFLKAVGIGRQMLAQGIRIGSSAKVP